MGSQSRSQLTNTNFNTTSSNYNNYRDKYNTDLLDIDNDSIDIPLPHYDEDYNTTIIDSLRSATRVLPLPLRLDPEGVRMKKEAQRKYRIDYLVKQKKMKESEIRRRERVKVSSVVLVLL